MSRTHTRARASVHRGRADGEERGREQMTLNRLGIGSGGRRSGNKREAKREKGVGWERRCVCVRVWGLGGGSGC